MSPSSSSLLAFLLCVIVFLNLTIISIVSMPSINVIANVRGKKYDITAETVEEFSLQVEELSGLQANQQSVLFKGKVLDDKDKFDEIGINSGDILNVLKGKKARSSKAFKQFSNDITATSTTTASSLSSGLDSNHNIINTIASDDDDDNNLNFDINSAFSGSSSAEDALKNMNPEDIKAAMQSMDKMLDSNIIEDYFSDEQKLETARLQMLNNLDQYEQMMPGFKEQARDIAADPVKWKQAMSSARDQIIKMKAQRDAMRRGSGASSVESENSSIDGGGNDSSVDDMGDEE